MSWTDARTERLTQMWQKGFSASEIARDLGEVSRNAVIGKVHRLGLPARADPYAGARRNAGLAVPKAEKRASAMRRTVPARKQVQPRKSRVRSDAFKPLAHTAPVALAALKSHHCRFPVAGEMAETLFCGGQARGLKPYCAHHSAICQRPAVPKLTLAERKIKAQLYARGGLFTYPGAD